MSKKDRAVVPATKKNKEKPAGWKRRALLFAVTALIGVSLAAGGFAWYLYDKDNGADEDVEVMTPYFLYLKNAQDNDSLQFAVGNLHPGETKQVVICVTNRRPDNEQDNNTVEIARESLFYYDLEFAYTQNLAVDYNIYELEPGTREGGGQLPPNAIVIDGEDELYWTKKGGILNDYRNVSSERHADRNVFGTTAVGNIWNAGEYLLYQSDTDRDALQLVYTYDEETGTSNYEYDYYLVEIKWKPDIIFANYSKETDLVYVVVNAKQVMPTLKQETD